MPKYELFTTAEVRNFEALRSYAGVSDAVSVTDVTTGGLFLNDVTDLSSSDDSNNTIVDYKGRRWKRSRPDLGNVDFLQSGTGAVTRTAQDKLRDLPFSFEDFGAVGDGTTDDTDAINDCLTAAAASNYGVVTCRPNTDYKITSTITKPCGVTLAMADGSVLVYTGSGVAVKLEPDAPDDAGETYADQQWPQRKHIVRVTKSSIAWQDSAGNTDTTSVGIQAINQRYCELELHASGFYIGVEAIGTDSGYAAGGANVGNIYTVYARNNFKHILETRSGATGYVNQNTCKGGIWRNDTGYVATGSRGFDGSAGANGWVFINVNTEGANIEQIYRFGGPYNTIIQPRFENATAGMVKVLNGGGVFIVCGYIGAIGRDIVSCDSGGIFAIQMQNGSWFSNGVAGNACLNPILTGASGFFQQNRLVDGKILFETTETGAHKFYTAAGKYDVDDNPTGLTNPTLNIDAGARAARFRGTTNDAAADGTAAAWSWATANSFSIFRQTFHLEDSSHTYPMRLGATARFWSDSNGVLRYKNGSPSSTSDGISIFSLSASATYDPGSLADGAGATTTVACTGAALGDFAVASFSLDLQGITLTAWVSAADTVSVRFQNESGGTLDLASGTLRVRVAKV